MSTFERLQRFVSRGRTPRAPDLPTPDPDAGRAPDTYVDTVIDLLDQPERRKILVFQMGKVGSSAIVEAIRAADPRAIVMKSHFLSDRMLAFRDRLVAEDELPVDVVRDLRRSCLRERIHRVVLEGRPRTPLPVVSLSRDPLAQVVSAFFQNLRYFHPEPSERARSDPQFVGRLVDDFLALCDAAVRGMPPSDGLGRYGFELVRRPTVWFEEELAPALGLDVFRRPFDCERGADHFANRRFSLVLLRFEDLAVRARPELGRLLDLAVPALPDTNLSKAKPTAPIQAAFLGRLEVPDDVLDYFYESRPARHFYRDEERARMRARWRPVGGTRRPRRR